MADLYAVDLQGQVYAGVDTYIQVFQKMRYMAVLSWIMRIPGIYHIAKAIYRRIADNRARNVCDESCMPIINQKRPYPVDLYTHIFENLPLLFHQFRKLIVDI